MLVIGTNATIAPNTRYTMTAALGSALTATTMGGDSISFADLRKGRWLPNTETCTPTA